MIANNLDAELRDALAVVGSLSPSQASTFMAALGREQSNVLIDAAIEDERIADDNLERCSGQLGQLAVTKPASERVQYYHLFENSNTMIPALADIEEQLQSSMLSRVFGRFAEFGFDCTAGHLGCLSYRTHQATPASKSNRLHIWSDGTYQKVAPTPAEKSNKASQGVLYGGWIEWAIEAVGSGQNRTARLNRLLHEA